MRQIPVCEPLVGCGELHNVSDCIESNWISSKGDYISKFEKSFAKFCNAKYAVATTSGTAALHLALLALGISQGDEVIVPTFTMAATIFSILYVRAKPVLVDVEPDTFNIDPSKIKEKITGKTKAILIVHLYGHPCSMEKILKITRAHKLFLIEDAAEAHGAEFRGQRVGTFGDVAAFSFYANKIITTGEGGMVITNNKKFARRAAMLKDMAFDPKKRFLHLDIGFNYRMTNIQAAIGLAQMKRIDEFIAIRRNNACLYNKLLEKMPGITIPIERKGCKNVYWMYGIMIEKGFGLTKNKLRERLKERGIETRDFFIPMHWQPFFRKSVLISKREKFPVADSVSEKGFYLPSGNNLKTRDILYVVKQIRQIQAKK